MISEHQTETAEVRLLASSKNWIEGTAEQQLRKTAALPGMRLAVGLPDLHPGKGIPIGAAFAVELSFLNGRSKLPGLDVFSLLKYEK